MQAFILLLGALLFVFYQFAPAPVFYSSPVMSYGPAASIGAAIGGYIDNQNY